MLDLFKSVFLNSVAMEAYKSGSVSLEDYGEED